MIGIYVRVSGTDQNVAGQKREIQRWLDGNGIENPVWYIDKSSGDNLDRPAFQKLQADIFYGRIKTVVVWKLDRLSRSLRDGINVLADWCDKGLRVVSVTQQIDFNGAVGKMLAAVLLGVAQMEQETRRERQAAGISAAKERGGVYAGRQAGTTAASPQRAAELRRQGLSDGEIAAALHVSRRTVQRYLRSIAVGRNGEAT
jgi:DNA invertase Pin-like site-specific DNA recombinase